MHSIATPFVQVPAELLSAVRSALANDRAPMEAVNLLRQVGYELGSAVDAALRAHVSDANHGSAPEAVEPERFWKAAADFFQGLGWGHLEQSQPHPGVGAIDLVDWIESSAGGGPPGAHITTGIFTDLLGRLAGGSVVVMEVPAGPGRTRLLFGAGETLGAVYQSITTGATPDEALARLA